MINNCYECKYRKEVFNSAHSACTAFTDFEKFNVDSKNLTNNAILDKDTKEPLLEVNEYGYRSGWAFWPVNFDPVWITCKLPIEQNEPSEK